MKKKIKFFIKLVFGVAILAFLFSKASVQEFIQLLGNANYKFFILALFLYIIGQIISSKKWMIISQKLLFENRFLRYLRWYFLGMFYNTFLPTNIGGDVIKVTKMRDKKADTIKRAVISVLYDRITGVGVLAIFILIGSYFYNSNFWVNLFDIGIIVFAVFGLLILICLYYNEQIIPDKYKQIFNYVKLLFEKKCVINIVTLAIVFHIFLLLIHFSIAKMYDMNIPFMYYLLLYPITAIVASLPVSINGIGVKEFVYVYMLRVFEIDTSSAIMFVMTYNMVVLFSSMLGFIPYIVKEKH